MTGKRVFWYFAAFFGFIAAVNAVMMTLAIRTHSGVVTDHAYEKGLAYNQVVAAEKAQRELGWMGELILRHSREEENPFALLFTLKDKAGNPIAFDKATATITRPAGQGMDFTLELTGERTPVAFPANGVWYVRVDAIAGDKNFQHSKRIVVE